MAKRANKSQNKLLTASALHLFAVPSNSYGRSALEFSALEVRFANEVNRAGPSYVNHLGSHWWQVNNAIGREGDRPGYFVWNSLERHLFRVTITPEGDVKFQETITEDSVRQ